MFNFYASFIIVTTITEDTQDIQAKEVDFFVPASE